MECGVVRKTSGKPDGLTPLDIHLARAIGDRTTVRVGPADIEDNLLRMHWQRYATGPLAQIRQKEEARYGRTDTHP